MKENIDTQKSEALRLADKYEVEGFLQDHRFAQNEWCNQAAAELRSLYAENAALRSGCDASRHEIEALRTRVQELGQMARDCNSRRVLELQAKVQKLESMLAAAGAGGVEPLRKANHFRDATKMVCTQAAPESLAEPGWGGEWVTVPAKATLAMCEASGFCVSESRTAYARMIAAAPQPPADHLRDATPSSAPTASNKG